MGLASAVRLFKSFGDSQLAAQAQMHLKKNTEALNKYYIPSENLFAWAITGSDTFHKSIDKVYPGIMANCFYMAVSPERYPDVWKKITSQKEFPSCSGNFTYCAALREGDPATAAKIKSKVEDAFSKSSDYQRVRLDTLYNALIIELNDPNYWPAIGK